MGTNVYITTTIPYVNAAPHVGFALELVQADVLARYQRLIGNKVRLQTGTDENALKNVLSARARGIPVEQLVEQNAERFRALALALNISFNRFLRTRERAHFAAVHAFLQQLDRSDVYTAAYHAWYCAECEAFFQERELDDGRCPEHGTAANAVEEHNHFFRLSRYQDQLHELISTRRLHVIPEQREREVLRFLDAGLTDISISREAARAEGWGVPFPADPSQVVYVWIDALVNYLTGLGFPDGELAERFWGDGAEVNHLLGKNVWKFHAVYWPALLLSAGIPVPDRIVAHGFLTSEGRKISKSGGNAIGAGPYIEELGADALRYFLLRHVRPFDDCDFSAARLRAVYEADLANGLGNLCSRLTTLCAAVALGGGPPAEQPEAPPLFHEHLKACRFDQALAVLWEEVDRLNGEIAETRPWQDVKNGEYDTARCKLRGWVDRLQRAAWWLEPFLPQTSTALRAALEQEHIGKAAPLFPRIGPSAAQRATAKTP
jgi:methionyl-tRNA synthetase